MSTRSGKRIHQSLHENMLDERIDTELTTERKTRSRRLKENCEALNISLPKAKKRQNYVSYPTDDEASVVQAAESKPARAKKNALKEVNTDVTETKRVSEMTAEPAGRQTRGTKKFHENEDALNTNDNARADTSKEGKKSKKIKKKNKTNLEEAKYEKENDSDQGQLPKKKSRRKKGQKKSNSIIVEEIDTVNDKLKSLNNTNTSIDSFHSAAGSPNKNHRDTTINGDAKKLNGTFDKSPMVKRPDDRETEYNVTLEMVSKKLSTDTKHNGSSSKRQSTFDKTLEPYAQKLDTTFDKNDMKIIVDTTFEKKTETMLKSIGNSSKTDKLYGTFEISPRNKRNSTVKSLDNTFDKSSDSLRKAKNKSENKNVNTTFETNKNSLEGHSKSSLISSDATDGTINVTFDKSDSNDNMSRFSITSDDSKSENTLNTTPILIESSMETSNISQPTPEEKQKPSPKVTAPTPLRREGTFTTSPERNQQPNAPITPLKREGTFTKDGPDVIMMSPKPKRTTTSNSTLTKCQSLPSAGCTPFHSNFNVVCKEKSVLNVTHSIEKNRRSSVAEPVRERLTRVMFCSPVEVPVLTTQRKTKLIKSSMKGSDKSFLFEENAARRAAPRKRSYTASDADCAYAKRTRLASPLRDSVDRLSRPRTPTAPAKSDQQTPTKKPITPKAKSETKVARKLPNFAALHQRRFEKMESLDECQERKARRAKQLLVPTGGLTVLERSSPKGVTAPAVQPKPASEGTETTKPQRTKPKPADPPKPEKPGFTRFGFRLNSDANPFSIPTKNTEAKPQETKPNRQLRNQSTANPFSVPSKKPQDTKTKLNVTLNSESTQSKLFSISSKKSEGMNKPGLLKRQPTLPALTGTTLRKEVAKQVIMREKSATNLREKREGTRKENRTIIKGVRTNRRFELQMQSRNING